MLQANRVGGSAPSYKHFLALLGQYLNQQHARLATIAEVDNGFMVFFYPNGQYQKQRTLLLPYVDLLELNGAFAPAARGRNGGLLQGGANRDRKHTLLPQGYDTVFRALGHKLDQRRAICLTICEARDALYVDYWVDKATFVIREQRRQAVSHHQGERFDAAGIAQMIDVIRDGVARESARHLGALRLNPHDHLSALAAAFLLEDEGNYREAESFFSRIVSKVPRHPEAHYHLARLAYIRGDQRTALQEIRASLSIHADVAAGQDLLGRMLLQQRKLKDAVAAFERATALEPDNALLHYRLADAYQAQGRKEDAARELALVSQPQAAPGWEMVRENLIEEYALVPPAAEERTAVPAVSHHVAGSTGILPAADALLPPLPADEPDRSQDLTAFPAAWASTLPKADEQLAAAASTPPAFAPERMSLTTVFDAPATWQASTPFPQDLPPAAPLPAAGLPQLTPSPGASGLAALQQPASQPLQQPVPRAEPSGSVTLAQRLRVARSDQPDSVPDVPSPTSQDPQWGGDPAAQPELTLPILDSGPQAIPPIDPAPPAEARFFTPGAPPWSPATSLAPPPSASLAPDPAVPRTGLARQPSSSGRLAAGLDATSDGAARLQPQAEAGDSAEQGQNAVELAAEILMIQRALETEPNRADLHRKLGFLLARQGRTAEAATEFRKALQCGRSTL